MSRPAVSVVIPTFNRADSLRATLDALLAQETDFAYEVLVVDNNSTDSTGDLVRSMRGVRYVSERQQGLCHARNRGITASTGDVIALIDDDAIPRPDWLMQLRNVYRERPDACCVGGKIVLALPDPIPVWFSTGLSQYLSALDLGDETIRLSFPGEVYGGNFSVLRTAVDQIGEFRTDLDRAGSALLYGGDTEFCWRAHRAGAGMYYCGSAIVTHVVSPSRMTPRFFRRLAYGKGRTSRILGGSRPSLRETLTVIGWEWARALLGRPLPPHRVFRDNLSMWYCLGYLRQSLVGTSPVPPGPAASNTKH